MERDKMLVIALLGVIIGATGLGLGVFTMMQVQTGAVQGDDGDDGDQGIAGITTIVYRTDSQYPCSSQSEIEEALESIGTGHGTIIITKDITLSSEINIKGGGNYIIRGEGLVTLDRNANDETFNITNVKSLILKDLIIDTHNIVSSEHYGIYINEENDNPVHIQNVQISGGIGRGVFINSENVWIENCIITDVRYGIYLDSDSAYCHIIDNSIGDMGSGINSLYGIYLFYSDNNTISGNMINNISLNVNNVYGINLAYSNYNTITGNTVNDISSGNNFAYGISLGDSDSNTIMGNAVNDIYSGGYIAYGIYLSWSWKNSISGNTVTRISGFISSYGIVIQGARYNIITGNDIYTISTEGGYGIGIYLNSGRHNTVSANSIFTISGNGTITGIRLSNADYNSISGNVVLDISSGNNQAHGIYLSSSDYNPLSGNVINYISSTLDDAYGIYLSSSDYNPILGNNIVDTQKSITGYGIYGSGSDYLTVIGNIVDYCDIFISVPGTGNVEEHNVTPP